MRLSCFQTQCLLFNFSWLPQAVRTIRYYRSIGFHPYQRKKSGTCGLLRGEALPLLSNDLRDGGSITKSQRTPFRFCLYRVMTFWRACRGGTNKSVLPIHSSNAVYPVDFSVYKWVCLSTPFSHTKLLAASSWISCKGVCRKGGRTWRMCVPFTQVGLGGRAELDDNTTSLFCACWKACHTSCMEWHEKMFANCWSFVLDSLQHLSADTNNKESHTCHFGSNHKAQVPLLNSKYGTRLLIFTFTVYTLTFNIVICLVNIYFTWTIICNFNRS